MVNAIPDLWPDIEQSKVVPPVAILREQAAALGEKTGHLLEGRVNSRIGEDGNFIHSFYVVAPTLDNYSYGLFSITHGADQYPVTVPHPRRMDPGRRPYPQTLKIRSEKALVDYLREVLNSERTKRIVGSLLAQVRAAT
ncbi:MAG: hypothetical protein ACLQVL_15275 [Terriglobia bacterium]